MWKTRLSSKGQVVIPAEVRLKLGLKKGDVFLVKIEDKKIILEPLTQPPEEIFVEAGSELTDKILREAKASSDKAEKLLRDLGVE